MGKFFSYNASLEHSGGTVVVCITQIHSLAPAPVLLTRCHNELGIELASFFPCNIYIQLS